MGIFSNIKKNSKKQDFESGQAMVEFVISFPILVLFFFVIIQASFLYVARHITYYAAYCAARTAIVCIPHYQKNNSAISKQKIDRSAAIACMSIASMSPVETLMNIKDDIVNQLTSLKDSIESFNISDTSANLALAYLRAETAYQLFDHIKDVNIGDLKASGILGALGLFTGKKTGYLERFAMARLFTIASVTNDEKESLDTGKDVTVEVTHYYALRVPFASRMFYFAYINLILGNRINNYLEDHNFSSEFNNTITSKVENIMWGFSNNIHINLCLIPIRARCTMTVEGEISEGVPSDDS